MPASETVQILTPDPGTLHPIVFDWVISLALRKQRIIWFNDIVVVVVDVVVCCVNLSQKGNGRHIRCMRSFMQLLTARNNVIGDVSEQMKFM